MADPAFMQKLFIEEAVTLVLSLAYEIRQRGENFTKVNTTRLSSWLFGRKSRVQGLWFCVARIPQPPPNEGVCFLRMQDVATGSGIKVGAKIFVEIASDCRNWTWCC